MVLRMEVVAEVEIVFTCSSTWYNAEAGARPQTGIHFG